MFLSDDGFLVGGGESGEMGKLAGADSAHVEVMRIGSFDPSLGGLSVDDLLDAVNSGDILIPSMATVRPTHVCLNSDSPPELEARFDCSSSECATTTVDSFMSVANWQLKFLHHQVSLHLLLHLRRLLPFPPPNHFPMHSSSSASLFQTAFYRAIPSIW